MGASTRGNGPSRGVDRVVGGGGGAGRPGEGGQEAPPVPTIDIYARLSFAANGETVNVEDQIEMGTEDILSRGGRVGEVFTDNSKSAWNPKVVRKNWLTLMERLEGGSSDGVWVYNLDRFSRKVMEGERLLEAAQSGLHVWALSGEYDLRTADGRDSFRSAIQSGARESDRNSERTQRGKIRAVRQGQPNGGARSWAMPGLVPLDPDSVPDVNVPRWKANRRVLESEERVEAERVIARDCIHRLLDGESAYALSVELNVRGAAGERAALPVSGKRWRRETLIITLCRPVMAGLLAHNGEITGRLADIEPVVDQQVWELLVAKTAARKTGRPPVARHMLTGTIRCGRCGVPLKAYLRSQQKPYSDGSVRREYRCPSPNSSVPGPMTGCGRNAIDARIAEQAVTEAVVARLRDPRHVEIVAEEMAQARSRRAEIADKIRQAEDEADQLSAKVKTWGVRRVDNAMTPILREIETLQQELAQFDDVALVGASAEYAITKWERARAEGDVEAQRDTIRHVFPALALAPRSGIGDHNVTRLLWDGTPGQ